MGRLRFFAIIVSILTLAGAPARAAETAKPEPGGAWVLVFPSQGTPRWKARAIQEFVAQNLSGMDRIRVADELSLQKMGCLELETDCIVAALRTRGVRILVRGSVEGDRLSLESRETWTGDTVAATLAVALAAGADLPSACRLAGAAAAVVVGKVGTATCTPEELRAVHQPQRLRAAG